MRAWNVALSFGFPVLHTSLCIAKHIYVINSERGQGGGMGKKEERDRIHSSHGMSVIASTRFLRSGHFLCSVSPCFPGTAARVSTDNYLKVCQPLEDSIQSNLCLLCDLCPPRRMNIHF